MPGERAGGWRPRWRSCLALVTCTWVSGGRARSSCCLPVASSSSASTWTSPSSATCSAFRWASAASGCGPSASGTPTGSLASATASHPRCRRVLFLGGIIRPPQGSSAFGCGGPAAAAPRGGGGRGPPTAPRGRGGRHRALYSALQSSQAPLDAAGVAGATLHDQLIQLSLQTAILLDQVVHH